MTTSSATSFGELLRHYRLAAALSQEALAERAGLSGDAIKALERGRRSTPRPDTLTHLAAALGLTPAERTALIVAATRAAPPMPVDAPQAAPPMPVAAPVPTVPSVPAPPTELIGRERDVTVVAGLLHAGARLLTLTGPGGVGKTRLAIAVASSLQGIYQDGVAFVDLSPLRDPDLVPATIAHAFGLRAAGAADVQDLLVAHLRPRHLLLVLDNVEQVVAAAPLIAGLLVCPRLVILATSRVRLRVRAEQLFWVPPLATPPAAPHPSPEQVAQVAAVQLFVDRAQAVRPDFRLDATNAGAVADICARLDGLPLALELAAGLVRLLSPGALLARLERRLAVLTSGPPDLPARQRTLRATLSWSYDLLDAPARQLFARLAVFQGGRSLDAIEAICNSDGTLNVLAGAEALSEASLLRCEAGDAGEPRLVMPETIHEYARELLAAGGEGLALYRRHADYFLALAECAEPKLTGSAAGSWLAHLKREQDNMRAALQWTVEAGEVELGLRLATALWKFWLTQGYLSEGRRWFDRLLRMADAGAVTAAVRARALARAGWLAHRQNDFAHAAALLEESLTVHRAVHGQAGLAGVLINRALVAHAQGDYERASALLEESLALYRADGDRAGMGGALFRLGIVTREQGEYTRATALYEECLALHNELGDRENSAVALLGLGDIARDRGEPERAEEFCTRSLAIFRDLGERWGMGCSLHNLGVAAAQRGDYGRAVALLEESLDHFREMAIGGSVAEALVSLSHVHRLAGEAARAQALLSEGLRLAWANGPRWLVAAALEERAALAVADERPAQAARFLHGAGALRALMGAPVRPADQTEHARLLAAACAAQGDELGHRDTSDGSCPPAEPRLLALEQAVDEALGTGHMARQ